jgi:diguanylate cyclase (GGDEF)-like protein/PAS domain S-box-containing protein
MTIQSHLSHIMTWLRISKLLPWLVLVGGVIATYLLQQAAFDAARQIQQDNFAYQTHEITLRIEQRLATYEQVLHGVEGLFSSSKNVSRDEFRTYVAALGLAHHYPGIQGIGFSLLIPPQEKATHVKTMRKEGFPNYTLRPEGERDLYSPTVLLEPFTGRNLRAFGYDLYAEATCRAAMELARDWNESAMSGKVTLAQETGPNAQAGFLVFLPVYRNGSAHETLTERRDHIIGWVHSSFRMDDLMVGILGEQINKIDLEIWDGENSTLKALMYDNDGIFSPTLTKPSLYNSIQQLKFSGHTWSVKVRSLPSFEANLDTARVTLIQLSGILVSILLSLLVWQLARGRAQALNLAHELRIAAAAFETQEGIIITDAQGVILRVNQAFTEATGYTTEEVLGQTPRLLKSGRHNADFYEAMWEHIQRSGSWQGEIWDRRKNGEIYPKWLTITAIKAADGTVTHYVGTQTDMTERKAAEEEIKSLAFYDPLTRLPNRRLLMDWLEHALASSARSGKSGALLFIDLDNFKILNDVLGHDIGDLLLQQVAQRLMTCVRRGDTVARLGGDEFVAILEDLSEQVVEAAVQTETIGEKILAALNHPYQLAEHEHRGTASIGAALFHAHHKSIGELLKQADIAMYQAKKAGRNTLRFFDPQMQTNISVRASLETELRDAIENQQFQLYYQIQVDSSLHALGAEALIRWISPERGMVSPAQFIPLAEETGLILPIGAWVLETACAQLKAWQQGALTRDLVLAVNVSAKQFRQADFVAQVRDALQRYAVPPMLLKLELTESLLLENIEDTIAIMTVLNEAGVQFSLDDFGTGYSSLQYLKRLPLHQLKIDQSFTRDIGLDINDETIVRTIIAMAQNMSLDVIAEGVETEQQRQLLLKNGCTHYQGYLFGRPVPIEQFEALLKQG